MAFGLGNFEGTWSVTVGSRAGRSLELKKAESGYELKEGSSVIFDELALDAAAFTLKNDETCLSLWKDCDHLFGIELNGPSFDVWGATRTAPGSADEAPAGPTEPDWRLDEPWNVEATGGGPPVGEGDTVKIEELEAGSYMIFKNDNRESYDTLADNPSNRTLDGKHRTVALWDRAGAKNLIFAMVIPDESVMKRVREVLPDIAEVKEVLREAGGFLSFEVDLLAQSIVDSAEAGPASSEGVWGAEEG